MKATSTGDQNVPRTVAIVAMGASHRDYLDDALNQSGRHRVADETWAINAMAGVIEHDRAFIMDDLRYFARQARETPALDGYRDWLHRHPGPIYTSAVHPEYPGAVRFPLEDVLNSLRFDYFNSTPAYALAYAIHLGVPHVKLYGLDYTGKDRGFNEAGRACFEYWIAVAVQRGMKVSLSPNCTLCDHVFGRPLYGYAVPPVIELSDGTFRVEHPQSVIHSNQS